MQLRLETMDARLAGASQASAQTRMQLVLEPVDVWLFRDGRPFDAGSDHHARCLFPPYPSVIQGAIRSHELVLRGVNLRDPAAVAAAVGTAEEYGCLRLCGPFLARSDAGALTRYFPVPADAVAGQDGRAEMLSLRQGQEGVVSSIGERLPRLFFNPGEAGKPGRGRWVAENDLLALLAGNTVRALPDRCLFEYEERLGIGREDSIRSSKSELLYEAQYVRPARDVGLWLEMQGYSKWPREGIMRIGAEGHGAFFRAVAPRPWPGLDLSGPLPPRFKLYFAAPAYFSGGWQPESWAFAFAGSVTLEAVALSGYETIGGFDWAAGRQKASRRFVPAGSVYYFRSDSAVRLQPSLVNQAVTQWGGEIGFGRVIAAEWRG